MMPNDIIQYPIIKNIEKKISRCFLVYINLKKFLHSSKKMHYLLIKIITKKK